MSYFHQQNQPSQHSPQYHQMPPSMMIPHPSNAIRAQQRSPQPTSPYTNTAATPTTSHQQSQIRYQQQQQQSQPQPHSPINNNYYPNAMPQQQQQQYYQPQQQPQTQAISLDMHTNTRNNRSPPYQQARNNYPHTHTQQQRSPVTTPNNININNYNSLPTAQPQPPPPTTILPAYSSSNDSNQNTPQSQRSRFSPTIDAFPDTLPVLDEQHRHSYNMTHPTSFITTSSTENDSKQDRNQLENALDLNEHDTDEQAMRAHDVEDEDEDDEPIPSDEQKLSSSSTSGSLQRLIEQEAETASERAFLRELSQIALDETIQTNEKIVSDLTEIDEQMQLESGTDVSTTKTPSPQINPSAPSIGRSISHPLQINMKAPVLPSLVHRYKQSGSASIGTSPITSPIINMKTSHMASPPRIKMPTAHNMISYSSTATTPPTGADIPSPHTPNRSSYSYYQTHSHLSHRSRVPLSVTTTPNSYQYRQRNTNFSHITYPNTQSSASQHTQNSHAQTPRGQSQHRQQHHYPQTPTAISNHTYSGHGLGVTHHHLSLAQSTNLYPTNSSNSYCNLMGSQTPTPHMSRLRSKSATSEATINHQSTAMTASPPFHSSTHNTHSIHHGSMTPQHTTTRRAHSFSAHSFNSNHHNNYYNKHSRTEKIYNLLQQHGNCMKLSQFTMLYPQQFHEMLPASNRDNNLLKYLVQLPRILVIKCLSDEDIMIFYCETSSHRTVIDILRHSSELFEKEHGNDNNMEYKGMEIEEFTLRLAEKLNIASLSDCNIVDFLERWRVVELVENNKYVRLMPMGSCTVFLGNLNPSKWNENKVRNVLTQINSNWYNLRIRLNQTNYGLLNAFVDFKSMQQAQSAIGLIKNHLSLFENNNNNYDQMLMQQQQQQQQMLINAQQQNAQNIQMQTQEQNQNQAANVQNNNNNNNTPQSPHNIRVEMETTSARKNHGNGHSHNFNSHSHRHNNNHNNNNNNNNNNNHSPKHHTNNHNNEKNKSDNTHHNNHGNHNNNVNNFTRVTNNIYKLIRDDHNGQMLMSLIADEYKKKFGSILEFDGNPKYFVKMERLLLLNCINSDDVMIFFTPEPAYKLVVTILKQNPCGLSVTQFKSDLERRMDMALTGCDFNDFLMRWRFLSIRETVNSETNKKEKMVLFTPHSGSTVFFGNLNVECTESDIYNDLETADANWKHSSVRLKLGKGFAYAFVDFPTRNDAMKAVQYFDGKQAFKSKYVSADIEAIEQRKRHHNQNKNKNNHSHNKINRHNNRNRSYSNGSSPNNYNSSHNNNSHRGRNNHSSNNNNSSHHSHNKSNKTTVYLGNLRDDVTKSDIQNELRNFNSMWNHLTIRLNLRSGWSHAFVDFELSNDARKLINAWNNRPNPLTCTRLRCEISKRQM